MSRGAWNDANSTVIAAFRFDEGRQVLQVRSKRSGRVHDYRCTPELYADFLEARSKGRFVARMIRLKSTRKRRPRLLPH